MTALSDYLRAAREDLDLLRRRMARGEIDEATYDRLKERILADLSPDDRVALGTSTPQPTGVSPVPGTPRPLGPSGASGGAVRTHVPSLSDLDLSAGTILLDQWRLEEELGRGGFGAVFAAEELHLHEKQAVKVLDPAMVAKEELLARFRREVSLMRKLVHPRIVRVYDYREDLSQLVALISMELVTGGSVKQLLTLAKATKRSVPIALSLEILTQTLEALAEAHAQGVIHRDVTPGNVLLAGGSPEQLLADPNRDPQVKLVDFGIAGLVERSELSQKSRVLGTAAYVAPEVLDPNVEVTPAADVYGAGAMGYELLTGKLPLGRFTEPNQLCQGLGEEGNAFVLELLAGSAAERPAAKVAANDAAWIAAGVRSEGARLAAETRVRGELRGAVAAGDAVGTTRAVQELERILGPGAERDEEVLRGRHWSLHLERERQEADRRVVVQRREREEAEARRAESKRREVEQRAREEAAWRAEEESRGDRERHRQAAAARAAQSSPPGPRSAPDEQSRGKKSVGPGVVMGALAVVAAIVWGIVARSQSGGDTWRDERTGLLWTAKDNGGDITWDNAKSYCDNLTLGGLSDWRLPSIAELESFYDGNPSKTQRGAVTLTGWGVWSGDLMAAPSSAVWFFSFDDGRRYFHYPLYSGDRRALCVRRSGS